MGSPELLLGDVHYSASVDIWSLGTIFIELFLGEPPNTFDTEILMLLSIFHLFGVPSKREWPRLKKLKFSLTKFPRWCVKPLHSFLPNLEADGLLLVTSL